MQLADFLSMTTTHFHDCILEQPLEENNKKILFFCSSPWIDVEKYINKSNHRYTGKTLKNFFPKNCPDKLEWDHVPQQNKTKTKTILATITTRTIASTLATVKLSTVWTMTTVPLVSALKNLLDLVLYHHLPSSIPVDSTRMLAKSNKVIVSCTIHSSVQHAIDYIMPLLQLKLDPKDLSLVHM